jgi:hypothetical protein
LEGKRTLIQGGLRPWCKPGSISAQDITSRLAQRWSIEKLKRAVASLDLSRQRSTTSNYNFVLPESA